MHHQLICLIATVIFALVPIAPNESAYRDFDDDGVVNSEKLRTNYPLPKCVKCGEKLGERMFPHDVLFTRQKMGRATYELVRFCSQACMRKFTRTPRKSWKQFDLTIEEAAKNKADKDGLNGSHESV